MAGGRFDADDDFEAQDQAETFDESNVTGGEGDVSLGFESPVTPGEDMRTFEELPDVEDLTRAVGDRDDDEGLAEFDESAAGDDALEEDDELDYRAATAEHEADLDGLGPEDAYDEDRIDRASEIEGLGDEVADADSVSGGEDDFTNFQSKGLSDEDLRRLGYAEDRDGQVLAKPNRS